MEKVNIKIVNLSDNFLPTYATEGASGMDLRADIPNHVQITIDPGVITIIQTNLKVAIPEGYELQIRPRSGLAVKNGITCLNTPGTIDSDYRGGIGVILINHSKVPFLINHGDRIAQAVCVPVVKVNWVEVPLPEDLEETKRGEGGFNSTGVK